MVKAVRMREEVVGPRVEDYDADAGVADMLNDYHEAQFAEGRTEELSWTVIANLERMAPMLLCKL